MNSRTWRTVVLVMGVVLCLAALAASASSATVAGGVYHSLTLKADGGVVAWGDNRYGQCIPPWKRLTPALLLLLGN